MFLDIVGYTHNRSVEVQSDLVDYLNAIVNQAVAVKKVPAETLIFLPTGDGMCISIVNLDSPYDLHLQLAREILKLVLAHNQATVDGMRKFELRIGINANLDNFVTDINKKRNIAGAGISLAQRVMSAADGNQILVGQVVYETLRHREKYTGSFRQFNAKIKHGLVLPVYQYVERDAPELNIEVPSQFRRESQAPTGRNLPPIVAHYLAQSVLHRDDLKRHAANSTDHPTLTVLLWLLANDSLEASRATEVSPSSPDAWGAGKATFEQQYVYYSKQDFVTQQMLASHIQSSLHEFEDCFDESTWLPNHFVSSTGIERLKKEYPALWQSVRYILEPREIAVSQG